MNYKRLKRAFIEVMWEVEDTVKTVLAFASIFALGYGFYMFFWIMGWR